MIVINIIFIYFIRIIILLMSSLNQAQGAPESSAFDLSIAVNNLINAVKLEMSAIQEDTTHDHELQWYSLTQLHTMLWALDSEYYPLAFSIELYRIVSDLQKAARAENISLPNSQEEFERLSIGGKNFVQETRARVEVTLNIAIAHIKVSKEIERRNWVKS